jgi:putative DNA primase/helicase
MGNKRGDIKDIKQDIIAKLFYKDIYGDIKKQKTTDNDQRIGLCPFHNDNNPSFAFNTNTLQWICFAGCGKGSVFDFVMKVEGITFGDSLKKLASIAGIKLPKILSQPKTISNAEDLPEIKSNKIEEWKSSLTQEHYQFLMGPKRGLSKNAIEGANIGWCKHRKRYTIPIYDEAGKIVNIRLYSPTVNPAFKILNFTVSFKITKDGIEKDIKYTYGRSAKLYGVHAIKKVNPKQIFMVEGEFDRLVMQQNGFFALTGTHGCKKFNSEWVKYFQDRELIFVFDAHEPGREAVVYIINKYFKQKMNDLNIKIKVIDLGSAQAIELIGANKALSGRPGDNDVSDFFLKGGTAADISKVIKKTAYYDPSDGQIGPQGIRITQAHGFNYKKLKIEDSFAFCGHLIDELNLLFERQSLFLYEKEEGRYFPDGNEMVPKKILMEYLRKNYDPAIGEKIVKTLSTRLLKRVDTLDKNKDLINVKNGMLDWKQKKIYPHSPHFLSSIQSPIIYDPNARCPNIEKFMSEVVPADCVDLLYEFIGYCLLPDSRFEKAFLLIGEGANGKSVFLDILKAFIGKKDNISAESLQHLADDKYRAASLFGKLVNIHDDLSAKALSDSDMFKTLVSGNMISVEEKFEKAFPMENTARLIFSTNMLPVTRDISPAYYRRWIIIRFPYTFEGINADTNLKSKLTTPEELSGLLNIAIIGLQRLFKNDGFSEVDRVKQELERYKTENDSVRAFVESCCNIDKGNKTMKTASKTLYDTYKEWCRECTYRAVGRTKFFTRLGREFPVISTRVLNNGSNRVRGWAGIELNDEASADYSYSNSRHNRNSSTKGPNEFSFT